MLGRSGLVGFCLVESSWWKVVQTQRGKQQAALSRLDEMSRWYIPNKTAEFQCSLASWASNSGCHLSPGTTSLRLGLKGKNCAQLQNSGVQEALPLPCGSFNLPRTTPATRCRAAQVSRFCCRHITRILPLWCVLDATQAAAGAESCLCTSWGWRKQSPKRGFLAWAQSSGPACASPRHQAYQGPQAHHHLHHHSEIGESVAVQVDNRNAGST